MSKLKYLLIFIFSLTLNTTSTNASSVQDSVRTAVISGAQVVLDGDTLFNIKTKLGPFSPAVRAKTVSEKLSELMDEDSFNVDSLKIVNTTLLTTIVFDSVDVLAITDEDAAILKTTRADLALHYLDVIRNVFNKKRSLVSLQTILINSGIIVLSFFIAWLIFWSMRKVFPQIYNFIERSEGSKIRSLNFRSFEILSANYITGLIAILLKGVRLAISLVVIYYLIITILARLPWTHQWDVAPALSGILLTVIVITIAYSLLKALNVLLGIMTNKIPGWKGTLIKGIKVKSVEILSEERIIEFVYLGLRVLYFAILIVLGYFFITLVFSFFEFTRTWAGTLFNYILTPLKAALTSFINYLPSLFSILVIVFLTRYAIKFVEFLFTELEKGTMTLPGFYKEWAKPTYKIARFLVMVFAAIVIFPYLPGSDSPFFQGMSVFLGVLFSLGSTSAVANVVGGVVLTYMRPFQIGDRVKIADTVGDVVEKTLLVTRIRTVKNVDITIPNAMVLGSHIINFSSSAKDKGLILHTTITIGYDIPWKKVHELLLAAADSTENILKEPKPFILQTSLDDFYVSYELNAYTDNPGVMAKTYSELHQNIQDKFNEAGVEIMSPHYSSLRDGNQAAMPNDYLPKDYKAPRFNIFPGKDVEK